MSWLSSNILIQPSTEPLTLAETKLHCRVDPGDTTQDSLLSTYIAAARTHVEQSCSIKLMTQTVEMKCSLFSDLRQLPLSPIQSVTSITYLDGQDTVQTLDPTTYHFVPSGLYPQIRNKLYPAWSSSYWPVASLYRDDAITVTAVAGYASSANVPRSIAQAMLMMIEQWFDNRTGVVIGGRMDILPNAVDTLLMPFRRTI